MRAGLAAATVTMVIAAAGTFANPVLGGDGIYATLSVGGAISHEMSNDGTLLNFDTELDPGYAFAGSLGYRWDEGWRLEIEAGYAEFDVSDITVTRAGGTGASTGAQAGAGVIDVESVMANMIIELSDDANWRPYLLGGVGMVTIDLTNVQAGGVQLVDDQSTAFAYQMGFGIDYQINPGWWLGGAYRFMGTADINLEDSANNAFETELKAHYFNLRGTVDF